MYHSLNIRIVKRFRAGMRKPGTIYEITAKYIIFYFNTNTGKAMNLIVPPKYISSLNNNVEYLFLLSDSNLWRQGKVWIQNKYEDGSAPPEISSSGHITASVHLVSLRPSGFTGLLTWCNSLKNYIPTVLRQLFLSCS